MIFMLPVQLVHADQTMPGLQPPTLQPPASAPASPAALVSPAAPAAQAVAKAPAAESKEAARNAKAAPPEGPVIVDPFARNGVLDSKAIKGGVTREEVTTLIRESEERMRIELSGGGAGGSVDTKQLTDLLGSLAETAPINDMTFVGCVNDKAVYRGKDGATIVVEDKNNGKNASGKPSLIVDRCQK